MRRDAPQECETRAGARKRTGATEMTRDEHRKACIEAMARSLCISHGNDDPDALNVMQICDENNVPLPLWILFEEESGEAFDSLHGIARVVPIGVEVKVTKRPDGNFDLDTRSADLTNPPEEKP
jgi:hypothetical protein